MWSLKLQFSSDHVSWLCTEPTSPESHQKDSENINPSVPPRVGTNFTLYAQVSATLGRKWRVFLKGPDPWQEAVHMHSRSSGLVHSARPGPCQPALPTDRGRFVLTALQD